MPAMPPPSPPSASSAMPNVGHSDGAASTDHDQPLSMAEFRREVVDTLKFMAKFALLVLIIRCLLISSFNIPSESMQPRLLIGDYLIVNKSAYGYSRYSLPFDLPLPDGRIFARTPERGDVVVFKAPPTQRDDYIKRVIGLPGDQIQVVNGVVLINGTPVVRRRVADAIIPVGENMVEASYGNPCFNGADFEAPSADGGTECRYPRYIETLPNGRSYAVLDLVMGDADTTGVYQVPEGHLFLMGDNRDRSYDSRFPAVEGAGIGIVPQDNLVGEALVTIFSTDGSAVWYNPISWFSAARWDRIGEGF